MYKVTILNISIQVTSGEVCSEMCEISTPTMLHVVPSLKPLYHWDKILKYVFSKQFSFSQLSEISNYTMKLYL